MTGIQKEILTRTVFVPGAVIEPEGGGASASLSRPVERPRRIARPIDDVVRVEPQ